jgi:hypothetical protein
MNTPAGVDACAALDEFLEVIFADEDFFEDLFAAVVASWNASPPDAPPMIRRAVPPRGHRRPPGRARQLDQWSARAAAGRAWQLRTARSPPGNQHS